MGKEIMIRDLTFSYGGNGNQLEHISLDIAAGKVIVMTGPCSLQTIWINGLRLSERESSPQHSARIKGWSKARLARISAKKS